MSLKHLNISIKDHELPLPMIPFGIVVYAFVGQPFSKQLYVTVYETNVSLSIYLINLFNGLFNFQVLCNYQNNVHAARCNQFAPFSLRFQQNSLVSV